LWLHSLKVAQLLRSAACLHTNQSRSYLNHLVFYQEVSSIRKRFNPQTLLIRNKTGHIVSNKESHAKVAWTLLDALRTARWKRQWQWRRVDDVRANCRNICWTTKWWQSVNWELDMIKFRPNWLKWKGKSSMRSFMNSF